MKPHTFLRVVVLAVAAAGITKSASAAPIVYSDPTAFHAAAGATSVLTFDDLAPGAVSVCLPAFPYTGDPCELDYGGATFVATVGLPAFDQNPLLMADPWSGAPSSNALGSAMIPLNEGDFYFTLDSPVVGFRGISGGDGTPVYVVLEDANGQTWNYDFAAGPFDGQFFGAVSDVNFTKVSLYTAPFLSPFGNMQTSNFTIDDVELQSTDVPEPSALALVAGGLVAAVRRKRISW